MGTTPKLRLPYPELPEPADVPADIQQLAVALDGVFGTAAALPGSPVAGQRALYAPAAGLVWDLLSDGARWSFLGGAPISAAVPTAESKTTQAYGDLTTVGPQVTVPAAGDYYIDIQAQATGVAAEMARIAVKVGAAATVDADGVFGGFNANGGQGLWRRLLRTGLTAGTVLLLQYRTSAGGAITFANRTIAITPARL